jgi:Helix-turn-helix domain
VRSLLANWRNALRDSELDTTAKAVGFVIATYADAHGVSFPSKETIAAGASLKSHRAADRAVLRLEAAGLLTVVDRSRGRMSNIYKLITPYRETGLAGANPVPIGAQPRTRVRSTPYRETGERLESVERRERTPALTGASVACEECGLGGGLHVDDCPKAAG